MPEKDHGLKFSEQEKITIKAIHSPANATEEQFNYFISECERRALVPGTHVVFQLRGASEYDSASDTWKRSLKPTLITTINALRLLADRYSRTNPDMAYTGHGPFLYYYGGSDGVGVGTGEKIPRGTQPHAVSVEMRRKDWTEPLLSVARFDAYVQKKRNGEVTDMWKTRGEEQLAKCAEAAGLRAIAPEELGGLYLREEMESAIESEPAKADLADVTNLPKAVVVPAVNQAPATVAPAAPANAPVVSPQPTVIPEAPLPPSNQSFTVTAKGGLFDATEPPPKDRETTVFPAPQPAVQVDPAPEPMVTPVATSSAPVNPATTPSATDSPATREEYTGFMQRGQKILHDLAEKKIFTGESKILATYLMKDTGITRVRALTVATWTAKLEALEKAPTLQDAFKLLKG